MSCELCDTVGGELLWQDDFCRVVSVNDPSYPGFCRVILNRHLKEMSDLDDGARVRLMSVVFAVEAAVREVLNPDKINLASLGNMTPHLHWHVIPRFADDRHFPNPIWGEARRDGAVHRVDVTLLRQLIGNKPG
jgi:diadenosine tetraphosphate (Ap4A) HIT family hydrolase